VLAASGFFPAGLLPGLWVPEDSLVEFGSSSECCRFLAARAPSRFMIAEATTNLPGTRDPPLLGFLLPRTPQRRVPRSPRPRRDASAECEECQLLAGAVLRVLAPLDGSGCATERTNPSRSPPPSVSPRRFAALFHAARVPGVALQSFRASGEPYPLSRALASVRVRVRPRPARRARAIHDRFPRRADPLPRLAREGSPDDRAVTTVPCSR